MSAPATQRRRRVWKVMLRLMDLLARRAPGLLLRLGAALGWVVSALHLKRRKIVEINLQLAFPTLGERARAEMVRANLISTGRGLGELLLAWRTPRAQLPPAEIIGLGYLQDALASGRGVLLLTAHLHPIELGVRLLKEALNAPVHALAREHNNARLQAWIDDGRRRHFGPTYQKKEVRALLRALKEGAIVAYAPDQNFNTQSEFLQFFGVPAASLVSWPRLLKSGNAIAITLLTARTANGYRLELQPLTDVPSADEASDAQRFLQRVEAFVRRYPEQYLWAHRRFKKQPVAAAAPGYPAR
jgi:Kdo2-lipid IVA lauroyltransferase/acyltransferase